MKYYMVGGWMDGVIAGDRRRHEDGKVVIVMGNNEKYRAYNINETIGVYLHEGIQREHLFQYLFQTMYAYKQKLGCIYEALGEETPWERAENEKIDKELEDGVYG